MRKAMTAIYICWVLISAVCLLYLIVALYPDYRDNAFPLFTDFALAVFLPAYFSMVWLMIHLKGFILKNQRVDLIISAIILLSAFVYSISIMDFNLVINAAISLMGLAIGFIHYFITRILFDKSVLCLRTD